MKLNFETMNKLLLSKKSNHCLHDFLALVHRRIEHAERMGQSFVGWEIEHLTNCSVALQSVCEINRVLVKMVVMTCDQKTRWKMSRDCWMFRIDEWRKCRLFIVFSIERFR